MEEGRESEDPVLLHHGRRLDLRLRRALGNLEYSSGATGRDVLHHHHDAELSAAGCPRLHTSVKLVFTNYGNNSFKFSPASGLAPGSYVVTTGSIDTMALMLKQHGAAEVAFLFSVDQ